MMSWLLSPIVFWGLGAGFVAILAEYLYRTLPGPWLDYIWLWIPMQLTIGYCIYRLVTMPGTSLLDAFIVFALGTALFRIIVSVFVLGDTIKAGTWLAFSLIILARIVQTWGSK